MDIELKQIANYILKLNKVPIAALKRTNRRKVYLLGKVGVTDIDITTDSMSILLMSDDSLFRELMHIYHDFEDHKENEFSVVVNKNTEIANLSFFEKKEVHKFDFKITNEQIKIKDEFGRVSFL